MSEDGESRYPISRCSSAGSLNNVTSSANNSDDEDSDLGAGPPPSAAGGAGNNLKDKRREAHTQAEQKRRDSIKKGYDALQELVPMMPSNSESLPPCKLSKATILQKSIDYMQFLQNCKKKQEEELNELQKKAMAMTILKLNYETIVAAHHSQRPGNALRQVSDDMKFQVRGRQCSSDRSGGGRTESISPCTMFAQPTEMFVVDREDDNAVVTEVVEGVLSQAAPAL
ncbi:hypothetical protein HAZT_HAZT003936, partial [Hyalella azteca]